MKAWHCALLLCGGLAATASTSGTASPARQEPPSRAQLFPASDGIVDLMVTGSAAKALYDRLPGQGVAQACGATGLHKGNGRISCVSQEGDHYCHIWIDVPAEALTDPEGDDC